MLAIGSGSLFFGIWNTVAGGNSIAATGGMGAGMYVAAEPPINAFDSNCATKYTSFGECPATNPSGNLTCGTKTGFYVTLQGGAVVVHSFRFCTGNDFPERDPMTLTVEGSNSTGAALNLGSSWTLLYNGLSGLSIDPGRNSLGQTVAIPSNTVAYLSYRILISSKRAANYVCQYSELQLFGY